MKFQKTHIENKESNYRTSGTRFRIRLARVTWEWRLRYSPDGWKSFSFVGSRWNHINKEE